MTKPTSSSTFPAAAPRRMLHHGVAMLAALALASPMAAMAGVKQPAEPGAPLGLVLQSTGSVSQGEDAASVPAGAMLAEGSTLTLGDDGRLLFSLITSCNEIVLEGPGKARLVEGKLLLDGARVTASTKAPGCVEAERVTLSTASQTSFGAITVRAADPEPTGRLSPRSGAVTASRRTFTWDGPLADGRDVLLTLARGEKKGDLVLEETVTGGSFALPKDVALVPGALYAWSVEPDGLEPGPQLAGSFRVAEDAVATQLDTLRGRASDAAGWLRVAFFCEVHSLEVDAASAYSQALALDPSASGASGRLAELDLP